MVYLNFPTTLTEEELMLQSKYQKLKKKKKALQQLKAPKPEPEKPAVQKRPSLANAKELAKKLLKSGAISAIKVEVKDKQGFKRSKNLERKLSSTEKPGLATVGYQPFSQTHPNEEEEKEPQNESPTFSRPPIKGLYQSFVSARDSEIRDKERSAEKDRDGRPERPKQGNTVYVHGYGVNEEILRTGFSSFGTILNISMEMDKNCGFITFEKMENADKAIAELNGSTIMGIQIKASLARRQPIIEPGNESSWSTSSWSTIAASHSQKGCHKDKRDLVQYDDDFMN